MVIDRFEGEWAVLVPSGAAAEEVKRVPRSQLPADAREGDVLDATTFAVNREATKRAKEDVRNTRDAAFAGKKNTPGGSI